MKSGSCPFLTIFQAVANVVSKIPVPYVDNKIHVRTILAGSLAKYDVSNPLVFNLLFGSDVLNVNGSKIGSNLNTHRDSHVRVPNIK